MLSLARSELEFRRASYSTSERAALLALRRLDPASPRVSRAWFRAGQAAHFQDDPAGATEYYERALATATVIDERRNVLWGLFNLAAENESDRGLEYLTAFEQAGPQDQTTRLRVAGARLAVAVRRGGVQLPLEEALAARPLLASVPDPVARSGFLNAVAHGLVVAARYVEARHMAAIEIADAKRHHLSFVLPHGQLLRAAANFGLRRFDVALHELSVLRFEPSDAHVAINASILQSKIALAQHDYEAAYGWVERDWTHPPSAAMRGELIAMRALICACASEPRRALDPRQIGTHSDAVT